MCFSATPGGSGGDSWMGGTGGAPTSPYLSAGTGLIGDGSGAVTSHMGVASHHGYTPPAAMWSLAPSGGGGGTRSWASIPPYIHPTTRSDMLSCNLCSCFFYLQIVEWLIKS